MKNVYAALLHSPVYNKEGKIVTTAITCFDLHDIARTALTYGVKKYYVVNPLPSQRKLAERITHYWQEGPSSGWNPTRRDAFQVVRVVERLEDALRDIESLSGTRPLTVVTTARSWPGAVSYENLRQRIEGEDKPWLLLFGTGWGLAEEVKEASDFVLKPIEGNSDYNHLPVRSAVAIILDRLLGKR